MGAVPPEVFCVKVFADMIRYIIEKKDKRKPFHFAGLSRMPIQPGVLLST